MQLARREGMDTKGLGYGLWIGPLRSEFLDLYQQTKLAHDHRQQPEGVFARIQQPVERLGGCATIPPPEGVMSMPGPPPGGMGAPGQGSKIPPEVMKQLQDEIRKQKMMKKLMEKSGGG